MPPLSAYDARDELTAATAARLVAALRDATKAKGRACGALSGGSTPEPAYRLLAQADMDWAHVTFLLVDERFVPIDHPASNEGMLRRALAPALDAGATLVGMVDDGSSLENAAAKADARYRPVEIDIALMGMGGDAHTASWFPNVADDALNSASTVVAVRARGAAGSSERLTLTHAAIARARAVLLLITGEAKRARLAVALSETIATAPVAALFANPERQPEVFWAP